MNAVGILYPKTRFAWVPAMLGHAVVGALLAGFVRVAYIHNAGYLGGLAGLVVAILYLRRLKNHSACPEGDLPQREALTP